MIEPEIRVLLQQPGVVMHNGLNVNQLADLRSKQDLCIPAAHARVLELSNGLEVYWGYFRLFGLYSTNGINAVVWNTFEHWKFAWHERCVDYWCFGETVWGDQYAYLRKECQSGKPKVYFLDALSMSAEVIAQSFEEFFTKEFLRCAEAPYDETIVRARQAHGPVSAKDHLVYTPSPLLGGVEDIADAQIMDGRAAMICNGDIVLQLDAAADGLKLARVEAYTDEAGRPRFRLIWS